MILLINQFYWPDSAATSQLLTDLSRGLKERGYDVHVICSDGDYAAGQSAGDPNVTIHRIKAWAYSRNKAGRLLSYASFYCFCILKALLLPRADLVITLTTPPLLSLIGTVIKFLKGSNHVIWEMDVYPDVAADANVMTKNSIIYRLTGLLADYSRVHADRIVALGECMKRRLLGRGISSASIYVADNWADGKLMRPALKRSGEQPFTLLYSGNLGLAHDADTILDTMRRMKDDSRFRFIFAGGGPLRASLEDNCLKSGLVNVEFRPYCQRNCLGESLGSCDAGLITQKASCLGSVVPSKLYGLLAVGRPVIFIGSAQSTVAAILRRFDCGWQIDNGDKESLLSLLQMLVDMPSLVDASGKRARAAFDLHFDLPIGVARICRLVEELSSIPTGQELGKTANLTAQAE